MKVPDNLTVGELIERLKEFPQELIVETIVMEVSEVNKSNIALYDIVFMNSTSKTAAEFFRMRRKQ